MENDVRISLNNLEDNQKDIYCRLDSIDAHMENKVSYGQFYWVIGILMTIILTVFGIIYAKIENVYDKASTTQNSVAEIRGILSQLEVVK